MGRSLQWYILPKNIEHDKTKQICIDLEFEPEDDDSEIKEEVYKIINYKSWYDCIDNDNAKCWCPKCHMYVNGLYDSSLLIDSLDISHSYSNSIWRSDWNVREIYMGSYKTDFVRRFKKDRMYREIFKDNLLKSMDLYEELGTPIRTSDVEAKEETLHVVNFLNKYLDNENYRVIIADEI